jgi:two-component system NtrC family sensor kinase
MMTGYYNPGVVALSIAIAIIASYTALDLANRVSEIASSPSKAWTWMAAGAVSLGTGIWSMHFIAAGGLQGTTLAIVVGGIALAIMILTIIVSRLDVHFAVKNARFADSLQLARDATDAALGENEKITAELRAAQSELVSSARQAGLAEIANSVLHNVGNVLNSVNVSAGLIGTRIRESKADGLTQAVQLMNEHAPSLGDFLSHDERGRRLPGYLSKLAQALVAEKRSVLEELETLTRSIDHIKDIVTTQQSYAAAANGPEPVQIEELLDDALRMNAGSMTRQRISIVKEIVALPALLLHKHLLLQILVNLIANAEQAMGGVPEQSRQITLRVEVATVGQEQRLRIRVVDNGEGIAPVNLTRLFVHGFTTRKSGHGFGLHSSALAAQTLGGTLTADSEGPGRGAAFTLDLPMTAAEDIHEYA